MSLKNETKKYITKQWKLLPCHSIDENGKCTCGNTDCNNKGKHPRTTNGCKDASSDSSTIEKWFGEDQNVNVAIATGSASGIFVLDIDKKHGGLESLEELEKKHGLLPTTVTVNTGGGGKHFFFKLNGLTIKNRANVVPGVDIRGEGGYVIAPPSKHASGASYEWQIGHSIDVEIADAPKWLIDLIVEKPKATVESSLDKIGEGSRNDTLFRAASSLRYRGLGFEAIYHALSAINLQACRPPLSDDEVYEIAKSAYRYDTQANDKMKLLHISELAGIPDVSDQFLAHGLLPSVGIAGLIGKPKTFKSTFARQLSLAVAQGEFFLGQKTVQGPVIYICLEDHPKRFEQHLRELGATCNEPIYIVSDVDQINKTERIAQIIADIKPRLVVIDTMQRFLRVADLADYSKVTGAIDPYIKIARDNNTLILFVHHAKKGLDESNDSILGSTAIFGSLDATLYLTRTEDRIALRMEQRYFANDPKLALSLDPLCRRFQVIGLVEDHENQGLKDKICDFLDSSGEATQVQIREAIGGKSERVIAALKELEENEIIEKLGRGVSGDPYRYRLKVKAEEPKDKIREERLDSRWQSSGQSPPESLPLTPTNDSDPKNGGAA